VFQNCNFLRKLNELKKYRIENNKKVFRAQDFGVEIYVNEFETIFKYIYFGFFPIPEKGKELRWLEISHKFGLKVIREMILAFLGTYFSLGDAVKLLEKLQNSAGHQSLYRICFTLLEVYDEIIFIRTKAYRNFSVKIMKQFVINGRISISELDFLLCVIDYCKNYSSLKKNKNSKFFKLDPKVFFQQEFEKYLRYPLMSTEGIALRIELVDNWVSSKYLLEAYRFNSSKKIATAMAKLNFRMRAREYPSVNKFRGSTIMNKNLQSILFKFYMEQCKKVGVTPGRKWSLLYRGSRDGLTGRIFHDKCNDKGSTMVIVLSENDNIFGGYASESWKSSSRYVKDPKAFLFHLSQGTTVDPYLCDGKPNSTHSLYFHQNYGPTFGGNHDLYVPQNMTTTNGYTNIGHSYNLPTGKNKYLATVYNFKVKEIEVFYLET